jgi:hypothetical protein
MDTAPLFFSVGQDTYRLRFPGLLGGFGDVIIEQDPEGRFDSDLQPAVLFACPQSGHAVIAALALLAE